MKKIASLFLFFISFGILAQEKEIIHELENFSQVKVYNALKLKMIPAEENRAVVTGKNRGEVTFEIDDNNILKVKKSIDNLWKDDHTSVKLYFVEVSKIDARQNAKINLSAAYNNVQLVLEASEGGKILTDEIEVENLSVKSLTGAQIEVKGKASTQDIKIRAGGQYYARYLNSEDIDISISAGGVADISASGEVITKVRAGGTVNVYGDPSMIEENTLFGGKVNKKN